MGLLGFDFFADAVVHVDFDRGIAEAIAPDHAHIPADAVAVAVGLDDKTPAVHLRAGTAPARVILDTGANRSVFETGFAERAEFSRESVTGPTRVHGIGGSAAADPARIPSFELGGIVTRDAIVDVSSADLGTDDIDGVLGTDLLRGYDLWFDDRAGAVYVRKSKR
jgi:hypothetical protein